MTRRSEVASFLTDFKTAMEFGHFHFVERQKNLQGLMDLGLTAITEAKEILAGLTPDNYSYGPEKDDDSPNEDVWFFGADVNGVETYIKLKLVPDPRKRTVRHAKVLGFHPAEHRIDYPLRGGM